MVTKYVRETNAAKAVSARVILKRGKMVATVLTYHGQGRCLVNVFQRTAAVNACAKACKLPNATNEEHKAAWGRFGFQHSSASGYGYDKETAALEGLIIDGHRLSDHCGVNRKPPKGAKVWPRGSKAPRGFLFANFDKVNNGYMSCYRIQGLKYLEALGYEVIQAI